MRRHLLLALTLALAYCSIVYELALAQGMAALLGNTFLRYNVTIAIYLAAMGAGSWLAAKLGGRDPLHGLVAIEWALALLGATGPLAMVLWDLAVFRACGALGLEFRGQAYQAAIHAFDHGLIVAIGLLSGIELPLLIRLGGEKGADSVLAADYGGTLAGSLAFPLLLLPVFGLPAAAAGTGLINALCGLALAARLRAGRGVLCYAAAVLLCAGLLGAQGLVGRLISGAMTLSP